MPRSRFLAVVATGLLVMVVGCGQSTQQPQASETVMPTPTAMPTSTPSPEATVKTAGICDGYIDPSAHTTQHGDLAFADVGLAFLSYPSFLLPENTSLTKPYQLHAKGSAAYATDFAGSPLTNPKIDSEPGGGYSFVVCNTSRTQTHIVQGVTAQLTSFVPSAGQVNTWRWCDNALDSHRQSTMYDCSGGTIASFAFHASFPSDSPVGTEVSMRQTGSRGPQGENYAVPLALRPGKAVILQLGLDRPQAPGRYTFTFGVQVDGQTLSSSASPVVLLAPVAHHWSDLACQNQPTMLAQIVPTSPETYYICPA